MLRSFWLVIISAIIVAGCTTGGRQAPQAPPVVEEPVAEPEPEVQAEPEGPVRIGLLLPLSGSAESVGKAMLDAATMAIFDVGTADVLLLPADTKSSPQGAISAANAVIAQDAEIILGPLFAASAEAIRPAARAAGINVIAFSNDASIAGDGVYVAGFRPEEQVQRVVEYARQAGMERIAAIAPEDAYGRRAIGAWSRSIGPADPGRSELYPPDQNAIALAIRRVADYDQREAAKERELASLQGRQDAEARARLARLELVDTVGEPPFDALLVADGSGRLPSVAALLSYYDVDTARKKLLGTMRWQEDLGPLAEDALQGAWIATIWPGDGDPFAQRFRGYFGAAPHTLAGLAYDATAMAIVISRGDRSFAPESIADPAGFSGHAGIFRFTGNGTAEHGLTVVEVSQGRLRVIDPAPSSFTSGILTQ